MTNTNLVNTNLVNTNLTNIKQDIGAFSPQELKEKYIELYAQVFECTENHATEMFSAEYSEDHDFFTLGKVEDSIKQMALLNGFTANI